MGPANIMGISPKDTRTSRTAKTYICREGKVLFFNYSNAQNIDDRHMIETFFKYFPDILSTIKICLQGYINTRTKDTITSLSKC